MTVSTEQMSDAELLVLCDLADKVYFAQRVSRGSPCEQKFLTMMVRLQLWTPRAAEERAHAQEA